MTAPRLVFCFWLTIWLLGAFGCAPHPKDCVLTVDRLRCNAEIAGALKVEREKWIDATGRCYQASERQKRRLGLLPLEER